MNQSLSQHKGLSNWNAYFTIIIVFLIISTLTSCSSFRYTEAERAMNNSIVLKTNVSHPSIEFEEKEKAHIVQNGDELKITFNRLKKSSLRLTIVQENYEAKVVQIKRRPRKKALIRDIIMFPLTLGLSTFDLCRSDFYRIAQVSQRNYVELDYTLAYMKSEFDRILSLNDIQETNRYISTFTKSPYRQSAMDHLRSLEFSDVIRSENEIKVQDFISKYPNTKESVEAQSVLNYLSAARMAFESASTSNTLEAYELFLQNFPNSIHRVTASRRLVEVAVNQILRMNDLHDAESIMNRSVIKYGNEIGFSVYQNKFDTIANHFSSQIFAEINASNSSNRFEIAKKSWARYLEAVAIFSGLRKSSYVQDLRQFIYNELFDQLKQSIDYNQQQQFINHTLTNFPSFFEMRQDIRLEIIDRANMKNGKLYCYGIGYWDFFIRHRDVLSPAISDTAVHYMNETYSSLSCSNQQDYHEEIQFHMNVLHGVQKAFVGAQLSHEANYNMGFAEGTERVWINGDLAMEKHIQQGNEWYRFEFEHGENITLRKNEEDYRSGLYATDKLDFESAFFYFESARDNELPYFHPFNEKVDAAKERMESKKAQEERRQAAIKRAEEEQRKLAELKEKSKIRRICICGIPFSHEGKDIQPDCKTTIRGGEFHTIDCALRARCPNH